MDDPILRKTFTIHQNMETLHGSGPDKRWRHTDRAGHAHAYAEAEPHYPTLVVRTRHVPCPDPEGCDCGGYDSSWYECAQCGERITPGVVPTVYQRAGQVFHLINGVAVTPERFSAELAEFLRAVEATQAKERDPSPPPPADTTRP